VASEVTFKAQIKRGVITPFPGVAGAVAVQLAAFQPDEALDVTVSKPSRRRSKPQNDRHWSLIVPAFEQLGYERFSRWYEESGQSPKDSAHNVIKRMFLEPLKLNLPDGTVVEVLPGSKYLTTAQFSEMDEKAERYLNSLGIYLPAKED